MFDLYVELEDRIYASFLTAPRGCITAWSASCPLRWSGHRETWRRGSTLPGVLDIVREIRERKINSFYVYFSWHLPLTFMFLSAKMGNLAAAQAELEAYAREYELAEDVVAKLAKLLRDLVPVENGRSRS